MIYFMIYFSIFVKDSVIFIAGIPRVCSILLHQHGCFRLIADFLWGDVVRVGLG